MFPNISSYEKVEDLHLILLAVLAVDTAVIFLTRYFPEVLGCRLNEWYDRFGLMAVVADVGIIFLGFLIARWVYTRYFQQKYGWSPIHFVILLVLVQLVHDIFFYLGVILPIPEGHNTMMDVFKAYSKGGVRILGGDALLMVGSAVVAMSLKNQSAPTVVNVAALTVYALSYVLYTKPVRNICLQ
jgi:hypothetical protein